MIYAMPTTSYGLSCVELCEGDEPFPVEAACPVIDGLQGIDMIIDNGVCREKTPAEKQAYQDAIAADLAQKAADENVQYQLNKSNELKDLENQFLLFCDQVTGTTAHAKLSIAQLSAIGATITDLNTKLALTVQLLSLDAQGKTYGGLDWWQSCTWHPERFS